MVTLKNYPDEEDELEELEYFLLRPPGDDLLGGERRGLLDLLGGERLGDRLGLLERRLGGGGDLRLGGDRRRGGDRRGGDLCRLGGEARRPPPPP